MAGLWFCKLAGVVTGPLKPSELRALAQAGKLSPDDLVRQGEAGPWVPARNVRGLFGPSGQKVSPASHSSAEIAPPREAKIEGAGASLSPATQAPSSLPKVPPVPQPPPLPDTTPSCLSVRAEGPPALVQSHCPDKEEALSFIPSASLQGSFGTSTPPGISFPHRRMQNNMWVITGLAVLAVALLLVVILVFTGIIPLGAKGPGVSKARFSASAGPSQTDQKEGPRVSGEICWVDASKNAIRRGSTVVRILSVRVGVPPASWVEESKEYLLVDVQIGNRAEDKFLFFSGWARPVQPASLLKVVDQKGVQYLQIPRKDRLGEGEKSMNKIAPGATHTETLLFEAPRKLSELEYLRLELPGNAFPKEKFPPFYFQLSAQMIRTGRETLGAQAKAEKLFGTSGAATSPAKSPSVSSSEPAASPKPKLRPEEEEFERLLKELEDKKSAAMPPPSEAGQERPESSQQPASEAPPSKPVGPRFPGQNILDHLDMRIPSKPSSQEKQP